MVRGRDLRSLIQLEACIKQARTRWLNPAWYRKGCALVHFRAGDLALCQLPGGGWVAPRRAMKTGEYTVYPTALEADLEWAGAGGVRRPRGQVRR